MNALIDQIYETGEVEGPEGKRVPCFPTAVPKDTAQALYDLVHREQLNRTLEVGLAYGLSALSICQAHQDKEEGHHTVIDPKQVKKWRSIGLENLRRAGLIDRVEFLEDRSDRVLPRLESEDRRFDFAFIDGWHLFDYALVDFFYIDQMLEVGGYVAFDDLWMPAMRRVISYILNNRSYKQTPIRSVQLSTWSTIRRVGRGMLRDPFGGQLSLKLTPFNIAILRKTAEDTRAWSFHRSF